MNTELKPGINWVGYLDWNVRDFHSFDTPRGATYNSYLIQDEKTALIDTVKAPFAESLLRNIAEETPLEKVDYVVCNHAESDHAGALPEVMRRLPNAILLCNAKCKEVLATFFDISPWKIQVISPEDSISLGTRSLSFINTPMVHWPESMFTYIPQDKLLFSMDAFGQHFATSDRFDDFWPLEQIIGEAKSYYANIVTPYGKQVLKTLEAAQGLPIGMIAPSHGLIWRKHPGRILSLYNDWASGKYAKKMLVIYDSMWGNTEKMAEEIVRAAEETGKIDVQLMHIRKTSITRLATEMLDAAAVALGSATLNAGIMPQMAAVITYIKGLKFSPKTSFAFGSSGWGLGAPEQLQKSLDELKWTQVAEPIRAKNRLTPEILQQCRDTAKKTVLTALKNLLKQ